MLRLFLRMETRVLVALKDVGRRLRAAHGGQGGMGPVHEAVMCFGSRGDPGLKNKGYYSQARITAERAQARPYSLTIGGGDDVPDTLRGRVLELIKATGAFGETSVFVQGEELGA